MNGNVCCLLRLSLFHITLYLTLNVTPFRSLGDFVVCVWLFIKAVEDFHLHVDFSIISIFLRNNFFCIVFLQATPAIKIIPAFELKSVFLLSVHFIRLYKLQYFTVIRYCLQQSTLIIINRWLFYIQTMSSKRRSNCSRQYCISLALAGIWIFM